MGLVAEAIQSGKGTLYRYFRSKEELFLAAVDLGLRRLREAVDASTADAPGPRERVADHPHAQPSHHGWVPGRGGGR